MISQGNRRGCVFVPPSPVVVFFIERCILKILVLGLRGEKQGELTSEFPDHEFKVIDIDQCPKKAGKIQPKYFDLVISMSYFVSHQTEKSVKNHVGSTPFMRVPGSISNLKTKLKDIHNVNRTSK